jgi:2'-5' RNA ligase
MYAWHVTFAGLPGVQALAARAQQRLAGVGGLDPVPARWLHLTMQNVGFTDEVPAAGVAAMVAAARRHLASTPPPRVRIGPARAASEGVLLGVTPVAGLTRVRDGLRAAIADTWSPEAVAEPAEWWPHISVAYSNTTGPVSVIEAALAGDDATSGAVIRVVRLIVLGRDQHLYQWAEHTTLPLPAHSPASDDPA